MRVVVTGGAGFIGKHLLDWLAANGHCARVIDDFSTGRPSHVAAGTQVDCLDLTTVSATDLAEILSDYRAEGVVHLAGMHFIPDCLARPERTLAVNTGVTHTLIEALSRHPVERVVLASTMDVYAVEDRPHAETDAPAPSNIYGLSKFLSEETIAYGYRRGVCLAGVVLRLANVYGPHETNPHLIPDVIDRLDNPDGTELVMGYLGGSRDFVFVEDVADVFGRAVIGAPKGFHRLNVGTGNPVAVRQVVQTLQQLAGDKRPVRENPGAFRKFDRVSLTPSVKAAETMLGWRASRQIAEGLAEIFDRPRVSPDSA